MFSYYTTRTEREGERTGGEVHRVQRNGDVVRAALIGPENPYLAEDGRGGVSPPLRAPFVVAVKGRDHAVLRIAGAKHELRKNEYTDWIRIPFRVAPGVKIHGLCRFLLLEAAEEFGLYVTPINIDSESPVMPISSPAVYSLYLTKRQGPFATLGLAEDTWALNEHVLGDRHFLQQCLDADHEREKMFFDSLDKVRCGLCVVVFDGTDRLQHMFWRDIDPTHPARAVHPVPEGRNVIEDLYKSMDALVGRTMAKCRREDNLLMVVSDHGFNGFRRGLDLNRWLEENGYLTLHEGRRGEEFLAGVDWSKTRAFAVGLTGVYLNLKGKFAQGIVEPGDQADLLREEIARRLDGLVDPRSGESAVKRTYITSKVYRGPYKDDAPDLIPGWQRGYRVSWETAIGRTTESVFHDNTKAWSGDHCIDPSLIPGVLFCNHPVQADNPRLMDLGPTILQLFGVAVPEHMDGKALTVGRVANLPRGEEAGWQPAPRIPAAPTKQGTV